MVKAGRTSRARRAVRLMKLGANLAGSYLAYQVQRPFVDEESSARQQQKRARYLRDELQNLRGPIMKIGQALSMQTHLLRAETIQELSTLQMHAPPMHPSLMRAQFRTSFGRDPEEVFRSFELEPFAAASLGQVHKAVTKRGDDVVVKIQYPAIREAIEIDFQMLRTAGFPVRLTGHLNDAVINEAERGILEETDYRCEARNIQHFHKALQPLTFIRVPKVYPELSTDQVLTMSVVPGKRLEEFLQTNPTQELRDKLGVALTHLFFFQLFRIQALHADPHPGNYLFNSDGTISLVDFGCVKYLKPEVVRCYGQFWRREWVHDDALFAEIIRVISGPKLSARSAGVRRSMNEIRKFYDEFHPLGPGPAPVLELADPKFMEGLVKLAQVLLKNKFLSADFLFLSRTESGMCNLLHILRARVPTTRIVMQWMNSGEPKRA
jgi:predicted unusual protein kinase regulating ubiquinone biosynthesis (AarF/ABC1/UbiB family)